MKIPTKFQLCGQTITVRYSPNLSTFQHGLAGQSHYRTNEIWLQASTSEHPQTDDQIEHSFFHELTHFVLNFAGEDRFDPPLHDREFLVDRIALLFHQAFKTAEYGEYQERGGRDAQTTSQHTQTETESGPR